MYRQYDITPPPSLLLTAVDEDDVVVGAYDIFVEVDEIDETLVARGVARGLRVKLEPSGV